MKRFWPTLSLILVIWWLPVGVGVDFQEGIALAGQPSAKEGDEGSVERALGQVHREEVRSRFNRGMRYYRSRQYEEAIEEFGKVLAIDPEHTGALRYLKKSHKKMADALEAKLRAQKRALERARREEADSARRREREELRQEARKLREGKLRKKREAAVLREEARAHFNKGKTYYLDGLYKEAIEELQKALALDSGFTRADKYIEKARRKIEELGGLEEAEKAEGLEPVR